MLNFIYLLYNINFLINICKKKKFVVYKKFNKILLKATNILLVTYNTKSTKNCLSI